MHTRTHSIIFQIVFEIDLKTFEAVVEKYQILDLRIKHCNAQNLLLKNKKEFFSLSAAAAVSLRIIISFEHLQVN